MADTRQTISFIDALRKNRVGALLAGLVVTVTVALVLSSAVPNDLNSAIAIILILLLAVAVGFSVKVTSPRQDGQAMLTAGGLAAIGVPILFGAGVAGVGFDDALIASLSDSFLTVRCGLAAIVAILVAAWGPRSK